MDNILVAVNAHFVDEKGSRKVSGIILTGGLIPNKKMMRLLKKSKIPVLLTEYDTYTVAAKVEHLICKIDKKDKDKIEEATLLVKKYVDIESILANS